MGRPLPLALSVLVLGGLGCRQDMHDQPKYKAYRASTFFGDERSARPLLEDTVARGQLREDEGYFTGRNGATPVDVLPMPVTAALVRRGQERYGIYCTPCHGQIGRGDGMVVQRGYRRPPSFHIDRLRGETPGYIYDVVTKGFGAMPDYASQIPVADRWAIVAYVRVLQLSENAREADVPPQWRPSLATAPRSLPAPQALPGAVTSHPASEPPPSTRPVEPPR
jgi:mono/diheme cytochrome c family protein